MAPGGARPVRWRAPASTKAFRKSVLTQPSRSLYSPGKSCWSSVFSLSASAAWMRSSIHAEKGAWKRTKVSRILVLSKTFVSRQCLTARTASYTGISSVTADNAWSAVCVCWPSAAPRFSKD